MKSHSTSTERHPELVSYCHFDFAAGVRDALTNPDLIKHIKPEHLLANEAVREFFNLVQDTWGGQISGSWTELQLFKALNLFEEKSKQEPTND